MTRPVTALKPCRYCHQNIMWTITRRGKWMPVDIEGDERGSVLLEMRGGVMHSQSIPFPPPPEYADACRHQPHSYTCTGERRA